MGAGRSGRKTFHVGCQSHLTTWDLNFLILENGIIPGPTESSVPYHNNTKPYYEQCIQGKVNF